MSDRPKSGTIAILPSGNWHDIASSVSVTKTFLRRAIWLDEPVARAAASCRQTLLKVMRLIDEGLLRFIAIAIGSLAETATFIELAGRLNYGNIDELQRSSK